MVRIHVKSLPKIHHAGGPIQDTNILYLIHFAIIDASPPRKVISIYIQRGARSQIRLVKGRVSHQIVPQIILLSTVAHASGPDEPEVQ